MKIKINKKAKIIVGGFLILFCGSAIINGVYTGLTDDSPPKVEKVEVVENKKEAQKITHKNYDIIDGKLYKDIELSEDLRSYKVPEGKWRITKLEEGSVVMNDGSKKKFKNTLITFTSDKKGNTDIHYKGAFEYEVEKGETVWATMPGEGTELYYEALN